MKDSSLKCSKCGRRVSQPQRTPVALCPTCESEISHTEEEYKRKSSLIACEECGAETWLVRNNNGSFLCDEREPPWTKHECRTAVVPSGNRNPSDFRFCEYCRVKLLKPNTRNTSTGSAPYTANPRSNRPIARKKGRRISERLAEIGLSRVQGASPARLRPPKILVATPPKGSY